MNLKLGEVSTIVVSSPEVAKDVMKTYDAIFAQRPHQVGADIICYGSTDIATAPYGGYWKQLRKICSQELLSNTRVRSFRSLREEEVKNLVRYIETNNGSCVNLSEKVACMASAIIARAAFGEKCKYQEEFISLVKKLVKLVEDALEYPLTIDNIKAVMLNMFGAGTDTLSAVIEWAMSEMLKNPKVMTKAQEEVRRVFGNQGYTNEESLEELKFLKAVIKETMRLHPPFPLLLPRECRETCELKGYTIPVGTKVIVNAWAIARDPEYWTDAEKFYPERFMDCISFAVYNIELCLAQLLYYFDWELPNGNKENLQMTEALGAYSRRKTDLILVPISYNPVPVS
ncbi:unnamed protein product [Sphenostylis stenocarpa]|uniref:Cytochrome P450 n=1 Tax=Sphenostylis stenocarpa TaxID=92480 RepID=A0AA86VJN0_9FABA|nr:unnamed protein product [Sphenostylis stenocarpa]